LAFAAAFFYGTALVLAQFALRRLPPGLGGAISVPTAALMFWLLAPFLFDGAGFDWWAGAVFAAVGLLFPAAVTILSFEANRRMGPNITGSIGNLAPVFAVCLAVLALGEDLRASQVAAIAAIVAGVTLLSLDRRRIGASWPLWALILPLAAAAVRGLAQPVVKVGLELWPSPFSAALIGYTVSGFILVAMALARAGGRPAGIDPGAAKWFAVVGVLNGLAVLSMYAALAQGPVGLVSPLIAIYPLITLGLSAVLLGPVRITWEIQAGVAATVAGTVTLLFA
jgi:drug/metabolite transporter (DMT)-like permease